MKLVQKQCLEQRHKAPEGENTVYLIEYIMVEKFAQIRVKP